MVRLPILRAGRPYESLRTVRLTPAGAAVAGAAGSGEPVAEVSLANPGLIARDLARAPELQRALGRRPVRELIELCGRAARAFAEEDLPAGDAVQSPADYVAATSATTGMPRALVRGNVEKIRYVLAGMERVLAGLTRGLDLETLDALDPLASGARGGPLPAYRRETDLLGAVLPANSPGVHALWLPAVALKVPLALKPGGREPWTPFRVAQALLAAGAPGEAVSFYPTDHAGAGELLLRAGRSLLFGDGDTVAPWAGDPRIEIHGPGRSKVVLGPDAAPEWRRHLDLLVESVAANGGRSCVNASGVWTAACGEELAEGLAARLAAIAPLPLDHPEAALAAFPDRRAAERLSELLDARLAVPGAREVTAAHYPDGRLAEVAGCTFLRPTVVLCRDPEHPLARLELPFPFVAVVEAPAERLAESLGPSLVVTALTEDAGLRRRLLASREIDRLNLAPVPTCRIAWEEPHEGNLFDHLYRRRAVALAAPPPTAASEAA